jgi:hypothetical protein
VTGALRWEPVRQVVCDRPVTHHFTRGLTNLGTELPVADDSFRVADYPDGILPRDLLRGGLGYLRRTRCVNFDEFI